MLAIALFLIPIVSFAKADMNYEMEKVFAKHPMFRTVEWFITDAQELGVNTLGSCYIVNNICMKIGLLETISPKHLEYVMTHEYAGVIWWNNLSPEGRRMYERVYKAEPACITEYSCTEAAQNYEEWMTFLMLREQVPTLNKNWKEIEAKSRMHKAFFDLHFLFTN